MYVTLTFFFVVFSQFGFLGLRSETFEFRFTQRMYFGNTTKVRWSTEVTIVKRQDLWKQPAVGVDPASVGKNCHKISDHERSCDGGVVRFSSFTPLNEDYHYSDEINLRHTGVTDYFDKNEPYQIFRMQLAGHFGRAHSADYMRDSIAPQVACSERWCFVAYKMGTENQTGHSYFDQVFYICLQR